MAHFQLLGFFTENVKKMKDLPGYRLLRRDGCVGLIPGWFGGGFSFGCWNVVQNTLAGIADYDLLIGTNFIVGLRTQHHLANGTFVISCLGQSALAELVHPVVVSQLVRGNACQLSFPTTVHLCSM